MNSIDLMMDALANQLLRLTNEDLSEEQLDKEINRSKAVNETVRTMTSVGAMCISARKVSEEYGIDVRTVLPKELSEGG